MAKKAGKSGELISEELRKNIQMVSDGVRARGENAKFRMTVQLLNTGLLLEKYINSQSREFNQNRNRIEVLLTLILQNGIMKPTDLSRMLFRSKQSITQTVDALERDGLVQRELKGSDRRTKQIVITQKGVDAIKISQPAMYELVQDGIPKLTPYEIEVLTNYLKTIRRHIASKMRGNL